MVLEIFKYIYIGIGILQIMGIFLFTVWIIGYLKDKDMRGDRNNVK